MDTVETSDKYVILCRYHLCETPIMVTPTSPSVFCDAHRCFHPKCSGSITCPAHATCHFCDQKTVSDAQIARCFIHQKCVRCNVKTPESKSKYCRECQCLKKGCSLAPWKKSKFCHLHKCLHPECNEPGRSKIGKERIRFGTYCHVHGPMFEMVDWKERTVTTHQFIQVPFVVSFFSSTQFPDLVDRIMEFFSLPEKEKMREGKGDSYFQTQIVERAFPTKLLSIMCPNCGINTINKKKYCDDCGCQASNCQKIAHQSVIRFGKVTQYCDTHLIEDICLICEKLYGVCNCTCLSCNYHIPVKNQPFCKKCVCQGCHSVVIPAERSTLPEHKHYRGPDYYCDDCMCQRCRTTLKEKGSLYCAKCVCLAEGCSRKKNRHYCNQHECKKCKTQIKRYANSLCENCVSRYLHLTSIPRTKAYTCKIYSVYTFPDKNLAWKAIQQDSDKKYSHFLSKNHGICCVSKCTQIGSLNVYFNPETRFFGAICEKHKREMKLEAVYIRNGRRQIQRPIKLLDKGGVMVSGLSNKEIKKHKEYYLAAGMGGKY